MITTPPKKTCPPLQLFAGWIVSVVLILLQLLVSYFPPKFTEFFEGDLALSYSVHDTVPYACVLLYCYALPTLLLCVFVVVSRPKNKMIWIHDIIYIALRSFACDELIIVSLKNFIGRPRPCFFQLCGYENTTRILEDGRRVVSYGTFGALGNVTKCHGTKRSIYNAFRSFPSGHSATAANATVTILLLLYRFIDASFSCSQYINRTIKALLSVPLVFWACFIVGSRIFDYRHRPEDVVGGIVIGSLTAFFVYLVYFHSLDQAKKTGNDSGKVYSMFFADLANRFVSNCVTTPKPESATV